MYISTEYLEAGEGIVPPDEQGVSRRGAGPAGHVDLHGLGHQLLGVVLALDDEELAVQESGDVVHGALLMAEVDGGGVSDHGDHLVPNVGCLQLVRHGPGQGLEVEKTKGDFTRGRSRLPGSVVPGGHLQGAEPQGLVLVEPGAGHGGDDPVHGLNLVVEIRCHDLACR